MSKHVVGKRVAGRKGGQMRNPTHYIAVRRSSSEADNQDAKETGAKINRLADGH